MKQLLTHDIYPMEGTYDYDTYYDGSGNVIKVEDLREWIQWHLRNRPIDTIYSDLDKALYGDNL